MDNYGFSDKEVPLYEALWVCNNELKKIDSKIFVKRIFLFTAED
jgi:hypothetical protein